MTIKYYEHTNECIKWENNHHPYCIFEDLDIVMSEGPGPNSQFIEAEVMGKSVNVGKWFKRDDGYWVFRITVSRASIKKDKL